MKVIWTLKFPCGKRIIFEENHRKLYYAADEDEYWSDYAIELFNTIYKYRKMKMPFETYKKRYLQ